MCDQLRNPILLEGERAVLGGEQLISMITFDVSIASFGKSCNEMDNN